MPFTKDGKVLINPRHPLGMDEFAALYSTEGRTPQEAASNIHLRYPMEAKSVMERDWRALGINEAPERYFATRARTVGAPSNPVLRAGPMGPMPAAAIPIDVDRNPTFSSVAERNLAMATGAYDPSFASPTQRLNFEALKKIESNDRAAIRSQADRLEPIRIDEPEDLTRSQLMGDTIGLQKKLLTKRALERPMTMGTLAPLTAGMGPYQPEAGYGALGGADLPSRLDRRIYNDPDFQEALRSNPEEAAYAYQRLTGRPLEGDIKDTLSIRKTQVETGRKYAQAALAQGANRDPITGKWKVWNMAEPEEGIGLSQPRANRMFVEATPEQEQWLNSHYESIMGKKMPRMSYEDRKYRKDIQTVGAGTKVDELVAEFKTTNRRDPTNEELARLTKLGLQLEGTKTPAEQGVENTRDWFINQQQINPLDEAVEFMLQDLGAIDAPTFDMTERDRAGRGTQNPLDRYRTMMPSGSHDALMRAIGF